MTNSQLNKDNQPSKASHQAGIDVGSEELVMVIRKNNKPFDPQKPGRVGTLFVPTRSAIFDGGGHCKAVIYGFNATYNRCYHSAGLTPSSQ